MGKEDVLKGIIALIAVVAVAGLLAWGLPDGDPVPVEPIEPVAEQPVFNFIQFEDEEEQVIDLNQLEPEEFIVQCHTLVCKETTKDCDMKCDLVFKAQPAPEAEAVIQ